MACLLLLLLGIHSTFGLLHGNQHEMTSTCPLNMNGNSIFNLPLPTAPKEAASKEYVDAGQSGSFHAVSYLTTDMICPDSVMSTQGNFSCVVWGRSSTMLGEAKAGTEDDISYFQAEMMVGALSLESLPIMYDAIKGNFVVEMSTLLIPINTASVNIHVWYHNKEISNSPLAISVIPQEATSATVYCDTTNLCSIPRGGGIPCSVKTLDDVGFSSTVGISGLPSVSWTASGMDFPIVSPPTVQLLGNEYVFSLPGWVMGENVLVETQVVGTTLLSDSTTFSRLPSLPTANTWTEYTDPLPSAPAACYHSRGVCVGAWCWKIGGNTPKIPKVHRFDIVCEEWTPISDEIETPNNLAQSANPMKTRDGKLHCAGGRGADGNCPNDINVFDITTELWEGSYSLPLQSTSFALNAHASNWDHGVMIGGYTCLDGTPSNVDHSNFWHFNPETTAWTDVGTAPRTMRGVIAAMTSDNVVHFTGGNDYGKQYYYLNMSEVTWAWTMGPDTTYGHGYGAFFSVNDYACVFGGTSASATTSSTVQCIRAGDASWIDDFIPSASFSSYGLDALPIPMPGGGVLLVVFQGYDYSLSSLACEGRSWRIYLP